MPNKADRQGLGVFLLSSYRKIPKISPGAYIFQRPLCLEGNLHFKIDWASLLIGSKFTILLCFTLYLRAIFQVQAPQGKGIFGGAI